ncbi:MAG: hypothetical protein Q8K30_01965 [Candidatus Gracilibacteria bacterium]|nr:hypothetical protein [Candidatus Gracilibacteria bacterium]
MGKNINGKIYYDSDSLSNKLDKVIENEGNILKQNLIKKRYNNSSLVTHV